MLMDNLAADDRFFENLRSEEFARLDENGLIYLDYAGSGLHGSSQLQAYADLLVRGVHGNPHSLHAASRASAELIEAARSAVLDYLGLDSRTHSVCFTANASAAVKLVAEAYPFSERRGLLLTADNHNSINGMREYARAKGAMVDILPLRTDLQLDSAKDHMRAVTIRDGGLFAYPAQSNFSGVRHGLDLIDAAGDLGYDTLLDAAGLSPFSLPEAGSCRADFIVISFYKLFGLPTGLGALIARNEALGRLRRPWFSGGTVDFVSVELDRHRLVDSIEAFEDGTPNFLGIAAVPLGFETLKSIGIARAKRRMARLSSRLHAGLDALRHANNNPVLKLYGARELDVRGATFTFNLLDEAGRPLPFGPVEQAARDAGIAIRGGCFCNPGAAEAAFGFRGEEVARCLDQHGEDFSIPAFAQCLGRGVPVGALRASLGCATTMDDLDRLLDFLSAAGAKAHPG